MNDVNWLFSACAQTAGAIVAIVGGLLASRAVRLVANRKRCEKELEDTDRLHDNAARRCEEALDSLREWASDRFGADVMSDILTLCRESRSDPTSHEPADSPRPLSEIIEEVRAATQVALPLSVIMRGEQGGRILDALNPDSDMSPQFAATMPEPQRSICERVFQGEVERARRRSPAEHPFVGGNERMSSGSECRTDLGTLEYTLAIQRLDHAETQLGDVSRRIETAMNEMLQLSEQPGEVFPWLILVHISVFGIVIPLALLPATDMTDAGKWLVLGPFFAGLGMLLLYFAKVFALRLDSVLPSDLRTRARRWWFRQRRK